jgi:hypothetical protein
VLQVNYDEKNAKGRDDMSDYSAQSEDSDQESGDEAGIDKPALKVRAAVCLKLKLAKQAMQHNFHVARWKSIFHL